MWFAIISTPLVTGMFIRARKRIEWWKNLYTHVHSFEYFFLFLEIIYINPQNFRRDKLLDEEASKSFRAENVIFSTLSENL